MRVSLVNYRAKIPGSNPWAGSRKRRRRNPGGPPSFFGKPFQKQRVFRQAFPNISLAVLRDFKGLQ
jgi:hypothetical protein